MSVCPVDQRNRKHVRGVLRVGRKPRRMSLEEGQTGIQPVYGREEGRREKTSRSAGVFSRNLWSREK